jgi:hypothetical protein
MDNFTKYTGILLGILGLFFGFIFTVAILILLLRFVSVALFTLPGSDMIYRYLVTIVPYIIFSGCYYYLYRKINQSKNKSAKVISGILLFAGCLICLACFVFTTLYVFEVNRNWLYEFNEHSGYNLVAQVVLVFFTAMTLGFGDPKEKDWLEKHQAS